MSKHQLQRKNPEQRQPATIDRTLQRALEQWQPNFINWWDDIWPVTGSLTDSDVYLRTAVSVDPARLGAVWHTKMRDYRWGIFMNPGRAKAAPLVLAIS